jgi:hypothetical protein
MCGTSVFVYAFRNQDSTKKPTAQPSSASDPAGAVEKRVTAAACFAGAAQPLPPAPDRGGDEDQLQAAVAVQAGVEEHDAYVADEAIEDSQAQ